MSYCFPVSKVLPQMILRCTKIDIVWICRQFRVSFKDTPHNCAQTIRIIPADQNFEKKRNSSALFAREINLVTQPSFDCLEQLELFAACFLQLRRTLVDLIPDRMFFVVDKNRIILLFCTQIPAVTINFLLCSCLLYTSDAADE